MINRLILIIFQKVEMTLPKRNWNTTALPPDELDKSVS